ncbi:MAG: hypothetical protein ACRD7E_17390, partial [Bryobacteraceae bacterium]
MTALSPGGVVIAKMPVRVKGTLYESTSLASVTGSLKKVNGPRTKSSEKSGDPVHDSGTRVVAGVGERPAEIHFLARRALHALYGRKARWTEMLGPATDGEIPLIKLNGPPNSTPSHVRKPPVKVAPAEGRQPRTSIAIKRKPAILHTGSYLPQINQAVR